MLGEKLGLWTERFRVAKLHKRQLLVYKKAAACSSLSLLVRLGFR